MAIAKPRVVAGIALAGCVCVLAPLVIRAPGLSRLELRSVFSWLGSNAARAPLDWIGDAPAALVNAALPPEILDAGGRVTEFMTGGAPALSEAAGGNFDANLAPPLYPEAAMAIPPPSTATPATTASPAAALFRKGDIAGLEALAAAASAPAERLGLEWAALRADAHPTYGKLALFARAHPAWPGIGWIRRMEEADLLVHPMPPEEAASRFGEDPPVGSAGKIAFARAVRALGREEDAGAIIRKLWRGSELDSWTEGLVLKEFSGALDRTDHKYRADRLAYADNFAGALRAAALAGPDELTLIQARAAAARGPLPGSLASAVPAALQTDPGLRFARIQDARRGGRALEAALLLFGAPNDEAALIDPDRWWGERRMVARQLLDLNWPRLAYEICAKATAPTEPAARVDAAFHAGWIALRFLDDAPTAARQFDAAAAAAKTPISIARAAYWQGRAAEAMGEAEKARRFFAAAAEQPIAYYGQLAQRRLGGAPPALRAPAFLLEGEERDEAIGVVEFLYSAGLDALATPLAFEAAKRWNDEAQLAALASVIERAADAATEVEFGKFATARGFAFAAWAFPLRGLPSFAPLAHSADLPSVFAVARQESEFLWRAASGAGAKGLMQILPSTAQETARRAGVAFDYARLVADPAFNTQLGAAYLGQLIEDQGGSREIAFAAYNAGAGRVAQWLAAYGDPRKGGADPVDWVERIPFDETREYVQRVSENLGVYRARLAGLSGQAPPAVNVARE